jgi:iron(III) transport system permease protein
MSIQIQGVSLANSVYAQWDQQVSSCARWLGRFFPHLLTAGVCLLVAGPIAVMLGLSFLPSDILSGGTARFSLDNYINTFSDPVTATLIVNTTVYVTGMIVIGLAIAFTIAWLMARTDMPGGSVLYSLMFIPMAIPPFGTAAGWILLLNPNAGAINIWLRKLFHLDISQGPLSVYSLHAMVVITGISVVPSMWLLLLGLFRNIDGSLDEAAHVSGVSRFRTLTRITVPLLRPGILGVISLYAIIGIELFEIPLAIGLTAGVPVLSTRTFLLTASSSQEPPNYGLAATYGIISMLAALVFIAIYVWSLRQSSRYSVLTGKGWRTKKVRLGWFRWLALSFVGVYFVLSVVLPFSILLWSSFLRFYQVPSIAAIASLTTRKYIDLFQHRQFYAALSDSLIVLAITPTLSVLLAAVISAVVVRNKSKLGSTLNILAFIPLGVPGTVAGICFLVLFIRTPLYGTIALFVLAYLFRFLAFTTRLTNAAQIQLDKSLEESGRASGVPAWRTFVSINLPLLAPALINGWLWVAVFCLRDFTFPLFLGNFNTPLWANLVWQKFEEGGPSGASPSIVLATLFIVVLTMVGRRSLQIGLGRH